MKYPKSGGKPFDSIRKKEFDKWRKQFEWTIGEVSKGSDNPLTKEEIKTAAWNCAFHVVTARTE